MPLGAFLLTTNSVPTLAFTHSHLDHHTHTHHTHTHHSRTHRSQTKLLSSNADKTEELAIERTVCVVNTEESLKDVALEVSKKLRVPWTCIPDNLEHPSFTHVVVVHPFEIGDTETHAIGIHALESVARNQKKKQAKKKIGRATAVTIDFCPDQHSKLAKRSAGQSGSDLLVKAVSPKKNGRNGKGAVIFDLTAGLGQDSLILLQNGASRVHMIERDPFVAALLRDALRRLDLASAVGMGNDIVGRLTLEERDGVNLAEILADEERPDICYLDPMFPPRTKSAAVKKNMRMLHGLLTSQDTPESDLVDEEANLLEVACRMARGRVVVKRPLKSPPLGGSGYGVRSPSYSQKGSTNRWDVYVLDSNAAKIKVLRP